MVAGDVEYGFVLRQEAEEHGAEDAFFSVLLDAADVAEEGEVGRRGGYFELAVAGVVLQVEVGDYLEKGHGEGAVGLGFGRGRRAAGKGARE